MNSIILYHGSKNIVVKPEVRKEKYNKDFYFGFYCTNIFYQAERWATRDMKPGFVNVYEYSGNSELGIKVFSEMTDEWLDFIANCRVGKGHDFDIVEGPMADDTIFNYVQNFLDGKITREAFWALAKFKKPTHQISFHTVKALECLKFIEAKEVGINEE